MNYVGGGGELGTYFPQESLYRPAAPTMQRIVNYQNMFSENPHHPSYSYKFSQSYNPIPGRSTVYFHSSSTVRSGKYDKNVHLKVAGPDRYKYFRRPLVGDNGLASIVNDVDRSHQVGIFISDQSQSNNMPLYHQSHIHHHLRSNSAPLRSIIQDEQQDRCVKADAWTQSDYRENEVQTEPYNPEYVLVPGEPKPEVLALEELHFTDGREGGRIGLEELKIVDRVRRRRKVESELPMGVDKVAFDERVKMLKTLEMEEWNEKEREIAEEQKEKLELIRKRLYEREEQIEVRNRERIEARKRSLDKQVQYKIGKLEKRRHKQIRKIVKMYDNPEMKLPKRDILEEYAFFGSKTYAPPPREGRTTDLNPIAYEIRPALLTDPLGIEQVQQVQIQKLFNLDGITSNTQLSSKRKGTLSSITSRQPINSKERKEIEIVKHIENAKKEINIEKNKSEIQAERLQELHNIYKAPPKVVRPPTPNLYDSDEERSNEEDAHNAAILLQKLLRGRAVQQEFEEGKERSLALIRELQAVEETKQKEKTNVIGKENKMEKDKSPAAGTVTRRPVTKNHIIDIIQGKLISQALDYLVKELVRQQEMRKIEYLSFVAEQERQQREEKELVRRRKEAEQRKRKEEELCIAMEAYNDTSALFLQDIIDQAVTDYSCKCALERVKEITQRIERDTRDLDDENIIRDVFSSFVLPQVKLEILKNRDTQEQAKVAKAVHDAMQEALSIVCN